MATVKSGSFTLRFVLAAFACLASTPALAACTVKPAVPVDIGSFSPAALKKSAAPYVAASSGFGCSAAILSLLSTDYMRATVSSAQNFKLISTTNAANTVSYTLAADAAGANPITAGTPFVYEGPGVNLLGLLGSDQSDVKLYVRPSSTDTVPVGTYVGVFKVDWAWKFCSGVSLAGLCLLGSLDTNATIPAPNATATITVTLTVAARPLGVVISTSTTWDPQSSTTNPRSTPGSVQRTTITLTNPDIVALDANSVNVVVPTPNRNVVALDGDKSATNAIITSTEGSPASTLALTYSGPASTTDDVDFSANGGTSWSYAPTAGDPVTQAAVTTVRFRPRGTMAAGSSYSVSLPYSLN